MSSSHLFILKPGMWTGEGKITLNMVAEELPFKMLWTISERDKSGKIKCTQEVQIQGLSEGMKNEMTFYDFSPKVFSIEMENANVGRIIGTGLYDQQLLAWEFRENDLNFEGYETYKLENDNSYVMHGEYITTDQLRTQIDGKIMLEKGEK